MIGGDENRRPHEIFHRPGLDEKPHAPADQAAERTELHQHVLVQNTAFERGPSHLQDRPTHAKDHAKGEAEHHPLEPWCMHTHPHGAHEPQRREHHAGGGEELITVMAQLRLLLFEAADLTRIAHRVPQAAQGILERSSSDPRRIILDQHLLVRKVHVYIVHTVHLRESLIDRGHAEGALHPADPDVQFFNGARVFLFCEHHGLFHGYLLFILLLKVISLHHFGSGFNAPEQRTIRL